VEKDKEKLAGDFKQVIGTIAILSEPLSSKALGKLLALDQERVHLRLRHLRSVLNVPNDEHSPIRLLHPSFRDFLLDKERCSNPLFWVDEKTPMKRKVPKAKKVPFALNVPTLLVLETQIKT
jgi:hypothetical protein